MQLFQSQLDWGWPSHLYESTNIMQHHGFII